MAPIFVLADDDREALDRLLRYIDGQYFYVPVWETREMVRYAKQFATTAIFLADGVRYPDGGSARLLHKLLDEVGKPVIILAESWNAEVREKWRKMGAADCIPHPTRLGGRIETLLAKIQRLALEAQAKA